MQHVEGATRVIKDLRNSSAPVCLLKLRRSARTISGVPTVLIQYAVKIEVQEVRVPPAFLTHNATSPGVDSSCSVDPASFSWMHGRP
jgi:hypothetical protein